MDTEKAALGLKIFGVVVFIVCGGALIWSLFRPAVTTGPMPEMPSQQLQK